MRAALQQRLLDLQVAVLGVRLGDVHDLVVAEVQLGQRVGPIRLQGPVDLPVDAVQDRQVGVQPGPVGAQVVRRQLEGVLLVVELTQVQVAVDRVDSKLGEQLVLHEDTPEPLQAHRDLAGDDRFRGDGEQRSRRLPEHRGDVELDDDTQDVPSIGRVGAVLLERDAPGPECLTYPAPSMKRGSMRNPA